jgi:hypothetical protein
MSTYIKSVGLHDFETIPLITILVNKQSKMIFDSRNAIAIKFRHTAKLGNLETCNIFRLRRAGTAGNCP